MAFRPRARRLWASFRAERRTLRQGLVALLLSTLAGLTAGLTLSSITQTLREVPGLMILIPAAVGMKGTIFGAIGARLGTSINAGLFQVSRDRDGVLYQNVYVGVVTTFSSALYLALLARASAALFGLPSVSVLDLVTISVVGGALGSAVALLATLAIALLSHRRGYDLDAVATPMVTAIGDMTTIPSLFAATFLTRVEALNAAVAAVSIAGCLYATVRGFRTDLRGARRAQLEMAPVIALTPVLDILAGTAVEARLERFADLPALLVPVPVLVSQLGALGGILASRLASKLHLGLVEPRAVPQPRAALDAGLVSVQGTAVFAMIGGLAVAVSATRGLPGPGWATLVGAVLATGLASLPVALVCAYYVAIGTARFGLDPDNHGVPIITSVMDLTGVLAYLAVLTLIGVTPHG
ncbi:MAG TPA: magnesium transporter [Actinomycetota bacterium]|nr:magnesium transporter [Actinomycetota bacterium]